ncbi:short-chain dehydrogenase/reductase SDR [Cryptococcus wingfieldii CBS 7118]|uniref:Short-chain dehydrogenase/reductase SDR n=1 Tax=Cryptococcus wingfieldii CBS 7118 TaxID=1295528 RepID=A0A1E3IQW7_9TREE|nr:short-chain dehydrogenase/reductase SDR [Cryptococcus wingfieldii CBS 7118]ODN90835.1 short-chain dehydrogenase/reductase SDR [Cryptococcus wingfieldii CBS 7118]
MSSNLKGQNAVVTGGGKNLGALIAQTLASQGVNVAIHYNSPSSKKEADATLEKLKKTGVKAAALQGDLTTEAAVEKFFKDATSALGVSKFNIAINTIGKVLKKPLLETSEKEFDSMFLVNSKSAFFFLKHAGKNVEDGGTILGIVTSLLGAFAPGYSTYQGSKAALEWFTKSASKELQPRGIRVNAIAPGPMDTPFFYPEEEDAAVEFHKSQALNGRLTKIEDIAPLVDFLVKDKWITGQIIFSNGGYTTR